MNVKRYEARLYLLPCVVCVALGELPPRAADHLHHAGDADQRNDWLQISICEPHHEGPQGIHGMRRRAFFKASRLSDFALLGLTNKLYHETMP